MRLIDADELTKEMNKKAVDVANGGMIFIDTINNVIDNAPTVETTIEHFIDWEKIKIDCLNCEKFKRPQGEWIQYRKGHYTGVKCSECNTIMDFTTNYCPKCGAYMKE